MATRGRSPNYPSHGLGESIELVKKLYNAEKRTTVPYDAAARAIGYTSLGGRARVKISSMRKFGLVDEANSRLRVSDLAMRLLFPKTDEDQRAGLITAAFKPDLFQELIPMADASDPTLVNDLVQRGFTHDGAKQAVASFRETVQLVGPASTAYDEPEGEDESMLDQQQTVPFGLSGMVGPLRARTPQREAVPAPADYSWQLPRGVKVELRFAGGPFTKDGLRVLRRYLDVMEETIPDEGEPIAPSPSADDPNAPEPLS